MSELAYCDHKGHCWHNTGTILACNPPIIEQVCCHCGEGRSLRETQLPDIMFHGKYHPDKIVIDETTKKNNRLLP